MEFLTPVIMSAPSRELKRGTKRTHSYSDNKDRHVKYRERKGQSKRENIAVLDLETDPFDDEGTQILPFCGEIYSEKFGSVVIWEDDPKRFYDKLYDAIESLPDSYTIYAHNGGKFDFCYLMHKLRGQVKFKGRAIMAAKIGSHELRDSLHIIPEKLSSWKKDTFDYAKLHKSCRHQNRKEILAYLHNDCIYLYDIVKSFILEFGFKISIGQAAFSELKKSYKVKSVSEHTDEFVRRYFFGGRVECFAGQKHFISQPWEKPFRMYDVNSMYPYCMASFNHPVGNEYNWRRGTISEDTIFVDVECNNYGALVRRLDDGETGAPKFGERARFLTTIWEFNAALKYDLIDNIDMIGVVDNCERSDFSKFIVPLYNRREQTKKIIRELKKLNPTDYFLLPEYEKTLKENLFLKYLLNNAFGKFAQNPRRFKEYYYTDLDKCPDDEWMSFLKGADDDTIHKYGMPVERGDDFAIWSKPSPSRRFNNVGTAASITGASRAILLHALQGALDPVYCDTDCLIARELSGVEIDASKLGAWDIEETYDEIIIAGKKLYAAKIQGIADDHEKRIKARCKGSPLTGEERDPITRQKRSQLAINVETWDNYQNLISGKEISKVNKTPTFTRSGDQYFMRRRIRATAPILSSPNVLIRGSNYAKGRL